MNCIEGLFGETLSWEAKCERVSGTGLQAGAAMRDWCYWLHVIWE